MLPSLSAYITFQKGICAILSALSKSLKLLLLSIFHHCRNILDLSVPANLIAIAFSLDFLITCSTFVFLIGVLGLVLNKRNLLILLMSIELMLVGLNLNFIFFSVYLDDILGQLFALYVLTVAAAESAIGLAIFTVYYRDKQTILLEGFVRAKG